MVAVGRESDGEINKIRDNKMSLKLSEQIKKSLFIRNMCNECTDSLDDKLDKNSLSIHPRIECKENSINNEQIIDVNSRADKRL